MIRFLYGQDAYRSRQKLREIIQEYKKCHLSGLNFAKIDFANNDFNDFKRVIETVSMFDEKKLVIIEGAFQQSVESQEILLNFLKAKESSSNSTQSQSALSEKDDIIIFWAKKVNSGELFQFLKKKAKSEEFKLLRSYELRKWIKKYTKEQGAEIEEQAVGRLIDYISSDLWKMSNEINKLISYKMQNVGGEIQIENKDIEILIKPKIDINIFNIIDALGEKNKKQALKLVHDYFKKGESWEYLLNRFIYQFRNLIKVKTGGGKDLHQFVFGKTIRQANNFTFQDLKKTYQSLLEIDINTKTGEIEPKSALEMFIVTY